MTKAKSAPPRFVILVIGLVSIAVSALADDAPAEFSDCDACPAVVMIEAGSFRMGSADGEAGRENDEGPVYKVTIAKPLAFSKTEVTRAQFAAFIAASDYQIEDGCWHIDPALLKWQDDPLRSWSSPGFPQADDHPVTCISWTDAQMYTAWLSLTTSKSYRLPSEAEWEFAARAGTTSSRFWGDSEEAGCAYANAIDLVATEVYAAWKYMNCDDGFLYTNPVGHYAPNPWGLFDLPGNLWEWTQDCWNSSYVGAPGDGSARLIGDCDRRVMRGAAWDDEPEDLRSANRLSVLAERRYNTIGIRVVRELN